MGVIERALRVRVRGGRGLAGLLLGACLVVGSGGGGEARVSRVLGGTTPGAMTAASAAPGVAFQQPDRLGDEFVPIRELPPEEQLAAGPLLVAAYGFVWVAVLLYLWSIWRRLGRVEQELADVARRAGGAQERV